MAASDARPVPIKNTAFRATFPILDADGDLVTGAASLDSEVSKDGGAFTDCTNEATEISGGIYTLDLTSTEMNADTVCVIVKTGTAGAKTTVLVFYPNEAGDIDVDVTAMAAGVVTATVIATDAIDADAIADNAITAGSIAADAITAAKIADGAIDNGALAADTGLKPIRTATAQAGAATTITLDASASAVDDFYNEQAVKIESGTGVGQMRIITDYVGATKVATVSPAWATNPSSDSVFTIQAAAAVPTVAQIVDGVWDEANGDHATAGTTGKALADILVDTGTTLQAEVDGIQADTEDIQSRIPAALTAGGNIKADVLALSGDATAADNSEAFFDGTGYAGTNNVIPTVTTLTNAPSDSSGVTTLLSRLSAALATALAAHSVGFGQAVLAAGSDTTSIVLNTVNGAAASGTNDHYNDRILILTSGALANQAAVITDYVGATKTLTVDGFTGSPAEGVTAIIV
jgi:uncharacterized protein (UPF0333 family)